MPRKRKAARMFQAPDRLEGWQQDCLLFGQVILDPPMNIGREGALVWRDSPAARAAWARHRKELLAGFRKARQDEQTYAELVFEDGLPPAEYWRRITEKHDAAYRAWQQERDELLARIEARQKGKKDEPSTRAN